MRYVDLTETVNNSHWRYPNYVRTLQFIKRDSPINSTYLALEKGFTHILAPSAFIGSGKTLDDYDLYDTLNGDAAILRLSQVGDGDVITRQMLEAAYAKCSPSKRLIIVTGLGRVHDYYSKDYWTKGPVMSEDAVEYLRSLNPAVVAFDFPEDIGMTLSGEARDAAENNPVHMGLLQDGILVIDHINFGWKIPAANAVMHALPLRVASGSYDYGSIRVIVKY